MKRYIDQNNTIHNFEDDCFDEKGNCINDFVEKIIIENSLISITEEEYTEIQAREESEILAEQKRLAKLPASEELEKLKIEVVALNLLTELGVI